MIRDRPSHMYSFKTVDLKSPSLITCALWKKSKRLYAGLNDLPMKFDMICTVYAKLRQYLECPNPQQGVKVGVKVQLTGYVYLIVVGSSSSTLDEGKVLCSVMPSPELPSM